MTPATSRIATRRAAAKDESNPGYLERRKEIVAAATRIFKMYGLQRANLGKIAAEAGADRASIYYYVGSKEELFHEVVREAVEDNLRAATTIRDGPGTAPDKLRALVKSLMASYSDNYPILYVFIQEDLKEMPTRHEPWANDMRRSNKEYEQIVVQLVQAGMDEGSIRPVGPAWVVAFGLMGMLGWTNRWFNPEESTASAQEIADAFADTILSGLELKAKRKPSPRDRGGRALAP